MQSPVVQLTKSTGIDSIRLTETMTSEFENPPHDLLSTNSMTCTSASDFSVNHRQSRPVPYSLPNTRTPLVRMDEVLDRLLDPYRHDGHEYGGHRPNPYRPSALKTPNRAGVDLTATWGGELRVQNEALVDENACAKEQTLRDLERLNAAGTKTTGVRGSYNQEQTEYVLTCSADLRSCAALSDNDLRVPSFLRNRPKMPLRKMQVPGMRPETGRSFASNSDSIGCLEMEYAAISDYATAVPSTPSSVSSSEISSTSSKRMGALRNSKMAKCVKNLASWRKLQKHSASLRETPAIREDRHYDYANDALSSTAQSLLAKGNCFLCLGGVQATKHSFEGIGPDTSASTAPTAPPPPPSAKPIDIKSILLTTSPLYGDVHQTPRSQINDFVYSTQRSLNIAATHNPTTKNDSDSEDESEFPEKEKDLSEIWDEESDAESDRGDEDCCPVKHWDTTMRDTTWEPPVLKTDQEYEMYQLQSRMEAETMARRRIGRTTVSATTVVGQSSLPSFICSADEVLESASVSSWDVKSIRDRSRGKRSLSHGSSSWSDFGTENQSVASGRAEFNNVRLR